MSALRHKRFRRRVESISQRRIRLCDYSWINQKKDDSPCRCRVIADVVQDVDPFVDRVSTAADGREKGSTAMTNITPSTQCIGLYECPPRKRRNMRWWDSCGETRKSGAKGGESEQEKQRWKALRFYYIILLMQRARRKKERRPTRASNVRDTKNIMFLGQKTSHEIFLYPSRPTAPTSACKISSMRLLRRLSSTSSR